MGRKKPASGGSRRRGGGHLNVAAVQRDLATTEAPRPEACEPAGADTKPNLDIRDLNVRLERLVAQFTDWALEDEHVCLELPRNPIGPGANNVQIQSIERRIEEALAFLARVARRLDDLRCTLPDDKLMTRGRAILASLDVEDIDDRLRSMLESDDMLAKLVAIDRIMFQRLGDLQVSASVALELYPSLRDVCQPGDLAFLNSCSVPNDLSIAAYTVRKHRSSEVYAAALELRRQAVVRALGAICGRVLMRWLSHPVEATYSYRRLLKCDEVLTLCENELKRRRLEAKVDELDAWRMLSSEEAECLRKDSLRLLGRDQVAIPMIGGLLWQIEVLLADTGHVPVAEAHRLLLQFKPDPLAQASEYIDVLMALRMIKADLADTNAHEALRSALPAAQTYIGNVRASLARIGENLSDEELQERARRLISSPFYHKLSSKARQCLLQDDREPLLVALYCHELERLTYLLTRFRFLLQLFPDMQEQLSSAEADLFAGRKIKKGWPPDRYLEVEQSMLLWYSRGLDRLRLSLQTKIPESQWPGALRIPVEPGRDYHQLVELDMILKRVSLMRLD